MILGDPVFRIIRHMLICLAIGVVTSVLVAWGCAYFVRTGRYLDEQYSKVDYFDPDIIWGGDEVRYPEFFGFRADRWQRTGVERFRLSWTEDYARTGGPGGQTMPLLDMVPEYGDEYVHIWRWHESDKMPKHARDSGSMEMHIEAAGWPLLCLWGCTTETTDDAGVHREQHWMIPLPNSRARYDTTIVPLHPIWGGLIANTILFGASWWLML